MVLLLENICLETLRDVVLAHYPSAVCKTSQINIVGGSPRLEYQVVDIETDEVLGAVATDSERQAWRYVVHNIIKS